MKLYMLKESSGYGDESYCLVAAPSLERAIAYARNDDQFTYWNKEDAEELAGETSKRGVLWRKTYLSGYSD